MTLRSPVRVRRAGRSRHENSPRKLIVGCEEAAEVFRSTSGGRSRRGHRVVIWAPMDSGMDELSNSLHLGRRSHPLGATSRRRAHVERASAATSRFGAKTASRRNGVAPARDVIHIQTRSIRVAWSCSAPPPAQQAESFEPFTSRKESGGGAAMRGLARRDRPPRAAPVSGLIVAVLERSWKELLPSSA